ncbi:MAG: hypothetical protein ACI8TX_002758 [Hyphomicrobiaceae bacterium]|jgi:hypothetical protein
MSAEEIEAVVFTEGPLGDLQRIAERFSVAGVESEILLPEGGGRG